MRAWFEAALAASLLGTALARSRVPITGAARPARLALCAALAALGLSALLHAVVASGAIGSREHNLGALFAADLAAMTAAASLAAVVTRGHRVDGNGWSVSLHICGIGTAGAIMAAELLDGHIDPAGYVAPQAAFLLVALVATVHGLRQPSATVRTTPPGVLLGVIGGAWGALIGTAWQRVSTLADHEFVEPLPDLSHVATHLQIAGYATVWVVLLASCALRSYERWMRSHLFQALEPLWQIVTDAAQATVRRPGNDNAAPPDTTRLIRDIQGVDQLYLRVIEVFNAWHVLRYYLPADYPDPIGPRCPTFDDDTSQAAAELRVILDALESNSQPREPQAITRPTVNDDPDPIAQARWLLAVSRAFFRHPASSPTRYPQPHNHGGPGSPWPTRPRT